jgi:uncharacterized protein
LSVFFADTSAIVKYFIPEVGSAWVRSWADPKVGNQLVISRLTTAEFISALARRQRESKISLQDLLTLRGAFLNHADKFYTVINLNKDVVAEAHDLLIQHPLRTLDALQLASALKAYRMFGTVITFVTADARLLTAAAAEGLLVDDPNNHP